MNQIDNKFNEAQETWLNELETTDKKQGRSLLRSITNRYCCLGVACEVLGLQAEKRHWAYSYEGSEHLLPSSVQNKLMIRVYDGRFDESEVYKHKGLKVYSLVGMNDSCQFTFKDIATFIRENPWAVFTNFKKPE